MLKWPVLFLDKAFSDSKNKMKLGLSNTIYNEYLTNNKIELKADN